MNEIIKTKQEQTTDFKKPADIVKAKVCKESGKLAIKEVCDHDPRGSRVITEYFEKEPFLPRPVISTLQLKYVKQAINSPQRIVLQTKNKEKFTLSAKGQSWKNSRHSLYASKKYQSVFCKKH